jgi:hypothetical protein
MRSAFLDALLLAATTALSLAACTTAGGGTEPGDGSQPDDDDDEARADREYTLESRLDPAIWPGLRAAPRVEITSPVDGASFPAGETVGFEAELRDLSDPPELLACAWFSDRDGALPGADCAGGASSVLAESLSTGDHVVTLLVSDSDGDVGGDSVSLSIEAPAPTVAEPGDLVITEMMIDPEFLGDPLGEWIEILNVSDKLQDIGGFSLTDGLGQESWSLAGPIPLAPGERAVVCTDSDSQSNGGVDCDGWYLAWDGEEGLELANGPDSLGLRRPDGVLIDEVTWDGDWFVPGKSSSLDPAFSDADANDLRENWCYGFAVTLWSGEAGTPGAANEPCD